MSLEAAPVDSKITPEDAFWLDPDWMRTLPPGPVLLPTPALILTEPPPQLALPTTRKIPPAEPLDAFPVTRYSPPEFPDRADPVDKVMFPLVPL